MQEKTYHMENLDCANCAAKIEAKFNALRGVSATITFATRQLRLTAEDPDALVESLTAIARTVEPEVRILPREHCGCDCSGHGCCCEEHDHGECSCGSGDQDRHHHEQGGDGKTVIFLGAGLFVLGLILGALGWEKPALAGFAAAWLVLGWEIVAAAVKNLTKGHVLDENFLMALASLGAFCIGEYAEGVGVMLFYRVGEYFEERAVARSRSQIMEAVDLRPEVVNRIRGMRVDVIPAGEARVGDLLLVRPGDRIPLDGSVVEGTSRIDTAPITGEPVPVGVSAGDPVISGCINTTGQLTVRVEKPLAESMVTRILNSVENAAASKPKVERFISRFARVYTPIVVALAVAVAVLPSFITGQWSYWVYTALSFLVMSCPCALVLSVPLAFFAGIGAGSKRGILFKGGVSIEALSRVKAVVMDKTGTLTRGDFRVTRIDGGEEVLQLAACCESRSTHPIAISIVEAAAERGVALRAPESLEELPGQGIRAVLGGKAVLCGSEKLLADRGVALPDEIPAGGTRVLVAVDGRYLGCILIADTLKPGAKAAVGRLKQQGLATAMLTGDDRTAAEAIGRELGIDGIRARLLPDEKLSALQDLRSRYGGAMFVGDGINDAPVLAGADVGAAMGSGADAAIEAADVVFMTSDPEAIPESVAIARRTAAIAWQNVIFALGIKLAVMVLGLTGHASMWMAVFADSGVAMLCVLNAIRLLYQRR